MKIKLDPKNGQLGADGHALGDGVSTLYDLISDPRQEHPLDDPACVDGLIGRLIHHFAQHDAPNELYAHFGLNQQPHQKEAAQQYNKKT
jgi:hypothetical protein